MTRAPGGLRRFLTFLILAWTDCPQSIQARAPKGSTHGQDQS